MSNRLKTEYPSPFIYGKTVSQTAFTNREDEVNKLCQNLMQGINTTIFAPRRWGKSSLVQRVIYDIQKKSNQHKIVQIDLFSVGSQEAFLALFAREVIKASSSKWEDWMESGKQVFKRLIPRLSIGVNPYIDFSIEFDAAAVKQHADEILNLPEVIGKKKNIQFVVCLDEFQNLAEFEAYEDLEKNMRAVWQRQKHATYCLYGSKRHMMTDIFNNPSKPFYRFGDIVLLNKIREDKWVSFIMKSFKKTNKSIPKQLAKAIAQRMQNHSWYVQQLSHYTWQITVKEASIEEVNRALEELIRANSPLYQREIELLTTPQISLLKAIAQNEQQLTSRKTIDKYNLSTSGSVVKNKKMLLTNDIIHEEDGQYFFLDPAFALWFNQVFFGIDYALNGKFD